MKKPTEPGLKNTLRKNDLPIKPIKIYEVVMDFGGYSEEVTVEADTFVIEKDTVCFYVQDEIVAYINRFKCLKLISKSLGQEEGFPDIS